MNVLFLTEGGANIGFGHVSRCLSLFQAFGAEGFETRLLVNGDDSVKGILGDVPFEVFDWAHALAVAREEEFLKGFDAAVVDSYLAGCFCYERISKNVKCPIFLDDFVRLDYPPGVVLNWSIVAEELNYPQKPGLRYMLGPKFISLREPFWDVPRKIVPAAVASVLITFGGDDSKNLSPKVMGLLNSRFPGLKKTVIVGDAFKNGKEIEAMKDENTCLLFGPDGSGMKDAMMNADLAISSGGQTLYELARTGTPAVVVAVAENQLNNVTGWHQTGFALDAGFWTDEGLIDSIEVKFEALMFDMVKRGAAMDAGYATVSGNGAVGVVRACQGKVL